jgi:putative ATPase
MDLFTHAMQDRMKTEAPLAARMRPRTLDEYIGQEHIVGPGQLMRTAGEGDIDFLVGFDSPDHS